jgi:hypothetical protein
LCNSDTGVSILFIIFIGGFRLGYLILTIKGMKKSFSVFILPILVISVSLTGGCRNKGAVRIQDNLLPENAKMVEEQIAEHVYPLPTSAEVIRMLNDYEVGYVFGISNPVDNANKYINSVSRAINLGVYGADLSYATLYSMNQQVINYLEAIRLLAGELKMSKIYDESLYEKIKQSFDDRDELVRILSGSFSDTYRYLSENDQQPLALLVVGGAWVEGMYLTTNVSEAAYQIVGISRNLLEQKKSFEKFIEIAKPYSGVKIVADFLLQLEPVAEVYKGLSTSLTEQDIKNITRAVATVREQLIQ